MVNTSKILTVSYGTFSCTLEGFDDSFETMKAIAEYFRDLAADDRYFGAEPPTPDAEMLARIAEREIARRVEAHEDQGKIVLRAGESPALAAALADAGLRQPEETTPAEPSEAEASEAAEPVAEPVLDAQEAAPEEAAEVIAEAVAETPEAAEPTDAMPEDAATETAEEEVQETTFDAVADAEPVEEPIGAADEDSRAEIGPEYEETVADTPVPDPADNLVATDYLADEPAEDLSSAAPAEAHAEPFEDEVARIAEPAEAEAETASDELEAPATEEVVAPTEDPVTEAEEVAEETIETAEEFFQKSAEPEVPSFYETEEAEAPAADSESVAAKLSRIRSVVSQSEQPYEDDDYSEDEHAQDFLSETAADLDAALAMDDAAELRASETAETGADTDADMLMSLAGKRAREIEEEQVLEDAEPEEESVAADMPATSVPEADDGFEDTLSQLLADSITDEDHDDVATGGEGDELIGEADTVDESTAEDDLADLEEQPADETAEMLQSGEAPFDDAQGEEAEGEEAVGDEDEMRDPLNARVIKMKNEDFEATIGGSMVADASSDEEAEDDAAEGTDEDSDDTLLSPEQEEDLQRELAEVEADLEAAGTDEDDEAQADAEEPGIAEEEQPAAREGRYRFDAADGSSDIERIFDEADSQLEKPESNQRRSAIQHLRAAVAATRAEKKAGADLKKNVDDAPYRSDLASVVRPRRPSSTEGSNRSERPAESRPAPLKLVAEQRVDTEQAPIRPRRVSATAEQAGADDGDARDTGSNFTEYARQMGATQLSELLEAAAAYMSDVEGRSQFSRPMLMHKIQEVEKENFSREDGLRSFGKLLRDGKIQKIKGGRFTVTDETEFRDEARHAG
ncbi:hypothetical protein AAFO92_07165 [Roseovarius sp. CAU 1744]|uniref:hypothetical protein n=1 Tax=Roseovarius sp. CAU 1744 TaxID=3140368 RepID=UPI00325B1D33